jgi:nucleoside-triphosphatase
MSVNRLFLTGDPGSGKTTVIRKVCDSLSAQDRKVGGMVSLEIREGGVRVGFQVEDIATHNVCVLAHVNRTSGPKIGRYRVNLSDLSRVGAAAIASAIDKADIIVVDEIGPMELCSSSFIEAVRRALESRKDVLGTIHKHASDPLVRSIKSNPEYQIIEINHANRDGLPQTLVERLR